MTTPPSAPSAAPGPLDRFLKLFTDVRSGESTTALLLAFNIFLILMAYYVLKVVREALILSEASPEVKVYMSAGQVVLLAFAVPVYAKLVSAMDRRRLINTVNGFFVVCLAVFYVLGRAGVPLGIPYFLWIGIFNLMVVAQFWSFANDVYPKDEGERLFPIVGSARRWRRLRLDVFRTIHRADRCVGADDCRCRTAVAQVFLTNAIDRRERARVAASRSAPSRPRRTPHRRARSAWSSRRAICS